MYKTFLISVVIFCQSILLFGQKKIIDNGSHSNLIAAVVGYHTTREVSNGIRIPHFSPTIEAGNTNVAGILFYVIAPEKYAGYYFYLSGDRPGYQDAATGYYLPTSFYWFSLTNQYYDVVSASFKISTSNNKEVLGISSPQTVTDRYYVNKEELLADLQKIRKYKAEATLARDKAEKKMKEHMNDRSNQNYRQGRSDFLTLKGVITLLNAREKNALLQQNKVKEQWLYLRKHVPTCFPWGDNGYEKDLEKILMKQEQPD